MCYTAYPEQVFTEILDKFLGNLGSDKTIWLEIWYKVSRKSHRKFFFFLETSKIQNELKWSYNIIIGDIVADIHRNYLNFKGIV